jgi:hypothetical protein
VANAITGLVLRWLWSDVQLLKHRPLEVADLGTPGGLASSKPTVAALHAEFGEDFNKLKDENHLIRALESAAWDHTTTLAYILATLTTLFMYAPAFIVRILTGVAEGTISVPGVVVRVEAPHLGEIAVLIDPCVVLANASFGRSRRCCSSSERPRPCFKATPCATSTSTARASRAL